MNLADAQKTAVRIKKLYEELERQVSGKNWSRGDIARGMVGDIGAAMKLMMAEDGLRLIDDSKNKLVHEMGDLIWTMLVLCDKYDIDAQDAFDQMVKELEERIAKQVKGDLETGFSKH